MTTYMVYCWRWPDADDSELDIFPIEMIGVAKKMEDAFTIVYDDIRNTVDDWSEIMEYLNKGHVHINVKVEHGRIAYAFSIPEFRYTWTVIPAKTTIGI